MNFTFSSIKQEIVKKLKEYSEWKIDILTLGVYSTLLDIVSYIIERLAYYVDFLFQETTVNATLRESIVNIAKDHGYIPKRKTGSEGYLLIGCDETFSLPYKEYTGKTVQINKYQTFKNKNSDIIFFCKDTVRLDEGSIHRVLTPVPKVYTLSLEGGTQTGIQVIGHGLKEGDIVYITGTKYLNGVWVLTPNTTSNRIAILKEYTKEMTTGYERIYSGYAFVPVKEGVLQEYTYISRGDVNEKIYIYSNDIDEENIEVYLVDEFGNILNKVDIVEDLYFVNNIETYTCEIENFSNYGGIVIKFGNDIYSRRTRPNERYLIRYFITKGSKGNVKQSNIVTEITSPFINVYNQIENLFVTNIDPILGGRDLETFEQIRKNYTRQYSTSKQLTKREAWISAVEEHPSVHKAIVWSEIDETGGNVSLINTNKQNYHYITAINRDGNALNPIQELEISNKILIPRKSPTDIISWRKLNKIRIRIKSVIEIKNTITFSDMLLLLNNNLKDKIGVLNLGFKQDIYKSNVIRMIDLIPNVVRHDSECYYAEEDIEITDNLKSFIVTKTGVSIPNSEKNIVKTNSPEIWIRRKIGGIWYKPLKIAQTYGIVITGTNLFNVEGTVIYDSGTDSKITYQIIDMISNQIPFINIPNCTTSDGSRTIDIPSGSIGQLQEGMYVRGMNVLYGSYITSIDTLNNRIIISQLTNTTGGGTGDLRFGWFPDIDGTSNFGARNPDDSMDLGYILYLVYKTVDGDGNREGDLRLSRFDQILDYSEDLSEFVFIYSD